MDLRPTVWQYPNGHSSEICPLAEVFRQVQQMLQCIVTEAVTRVRHALGVAVCPAVLLGVRQDGRVVRKHRPFSFSCISGPASFCRHETCLSGNDGKLLVLVKLLVQ